MTTARDAMTEALARTLLPPRPGPRLVQLQDVGLVATLLLLQTLLAVAMPASDGRTPDPLGWTLLTAMPLVLFLRRRATWQTSAAVLALDVPYHLLGYTHAAAVPAGVVALFSLAVTGPLLRTLLTMGTALAGTTVLVLALGRAHALPGMLRDAGWLVAVVLIGEAVRIHRDYVAAIVERAERAERTREEEVARCVAEERLRIARDLHDLLAHSITLIGVQTSVAAHVLVADPDRLDRDAVAEALDGIAETCRAAGAQLHTTLQVLRAGEPTAAGVRDQGPPPSIAGLPDLARAAEDAGAARVELDIRPGPPASPEAGTPPSAVGAAAYRIVQEALTNAVRHAGRGVRLAVVLERTPDDAALRVVVRDDGGVGAAAGSPEPAARPGPGFGLVGMRERARSVGGTLTAGPGDDGEGFTVTAVLPLSERAPRTTRRHTAATPDSRIPGA